jgi:PleD family two-component response regulator
MEYCSIRCLAGPASTITSANHHHHSVMLPNFRAALVVVDDCDLRNPIVLNLRDQGWIVHGIRSAERVFPILAHIPYELIIIDDGLPGIDNKECGRFVYDARAWQAVHLVMLITRKSAPLAKELAHLGALSARKHAWSEDLSGYLVSLAKGRS